MKKERTPGALIYARFSTENQSEKSIEEQVSDCRAWCVSRGAPVLGVYADFAVSGMKASRPQFDAALDALRSGYGDMLVCYDQSRLARDFLNWFGLRQELQALGVRIVSITQDYVGGDIQDSSVLIQETIIALHNQMHVADTKRKVKAALRYRAQQGLHTGGTPPLGYKVVEKRLTVDKAEAATVRRIFTEYADGKSYHDIIADLNRDGICTKRGSAFGSNSLHDLLKNRKYIGVVEYGALPYDDNGSRNSHGERSEEALTLQRPELAIISTDLFDRVQARMVKNKHTAAGRPATARDYPLKGKVFCMDCGSAMTVSRSKIKGRSYYYYKCTRKDRTFDCSGRAIRADELEATVARYVRSILGSTDIQSRVAALVRAEAENIIGGSTARFEAAQRRLEETESQIGHIVDAIAKGAFSDLLSARLKALEGERAQLRADLMQMRRAADLTALPEAALQRLVRQISADAGDTAVLSIVTRVEVGKEYIRIFTAFDPDHDPHDRQTDLENTIPAPGLTEIDGFASGVPIITINAAGVWLLLRR